MTPLEWATLNTPDQGQEKPSDLNSVIKDNKKLTVEEIRFIENLIAEEKNNINKETRSDLQKLKEDIIAELDARIDRGDKKGEDMSYIRSLKAQVENLGKTSNNSKNLKADKTTGNVENKNSHTKEKSNENGGKGEPVRPDSTAENNNKPDVTNGTTESQSPEWSKLDATSEASMKWALLGWVIQNTEKSGWNNTEKSQDEAISWNKDKKSSEKPKEKVSEAIKSVEINTWKTKIKFTWDGKIWNSELKFLEGIKEWKIKVNDLLKNNDIEDLKSLRDLIKSDLEARKNITTRNEKADNYVNELLKTAEQALTFRYGVNKWFEQVNKYIKGEASLPDDMRNLRKTLIDNIKNNNWKKDLQNNWWPID